MIKARPPDDYVNPFAGLDKMTPTRKRRVVPPSSVKVTDARLAFCAARQAAVAAYIGTVQYVDAFEAVHFWLDQWIDAEREERAE